MKTNITAYVHSCKESMLDLGAANGISGEALENFKYALSEVKIEMRVDTETGDAQIVKVNGNHILP